MPAEEVDADVVLEKIIVFVSPRRTRVREFFLDFDRLRCGRVSRSQFSRALNLVGVRLTALEAEVIAKHFAEAEQVLTPEFKVNYERFCEIVERLAELRAQRQEPQDFPRSDFIAKACSTDWSHKTLSPVKKVQSKVVEYRVRLYEHFQDFDALRKGFCTMGQAKTVFTILGLDKDISQDDFRALQECYSRADGMFCYADFCGDIDLAFTKPGLEMDPMATISMPDASSTLPARRNRQALSEQNVQKVFDLEEKIRARVKFRRCLLRSSFQDMDRTRRGHVTRSQFARVMSMLGFELTALDIDALCGVYCDIGNLTEFNYMDFCVSCDPKAEHEMAAATQTFQKEEPLPRYFDVFGAVHRADASNPGSPRCAASPRSLGASMPTSPRWQATARA